MVKFILFVVFLFVGSTCYAQSNKTDSLKREMDIYTKKDTIKINKIIDYIYSLNDQDIKKGIPLLKNALKISKDLKDVNSQILVLEALGEIAAFEYKFDESIPYLLEALKLLEATGQKKKEAKIHGWLSEEYRLFDNDSLRLFHAQKCLDIATAIRDSVLQKSALLIVGNYYDDHNEYGKADAYYNKALLIAKEQKDDDLKYNILGYKGDRLVKQKDYRGAISINKELLTYYQGKKSLGMEAYLYALLGGLYTDLKMKDSAYFYAYKGLTFSKKHELVKELTDSYRELYKSHYVFGDYKNAYDYRVIYDSLYNKTYNLEASQKVERSRTQIAQEKIDELAKLEEIRKEAEVRRTRNLQFTVIGFFVLLAGFLFWNTRQKQKANSKIQKAYSELKSTQSQLIQSEKMASLGELTAGIAHEIQNPLNFVNNFSEVNAELIDEMQQELENGNLEDAKAISKDIKENEQKINQHGKRADAIVKGMLQHSRTSSGVKEPTDINALADEYLRLAYHGLRAKDKDFNATLKTDFDGKIGKIDIIPQDIGRVILNLITNAFYAVDEKKKQQFEGYEPTVSVSTHRSLSSGEGRGEVLISVKDNGPGIPQKILDKIFQPFFTTKPTGQGTGLGLSLSYDIVKAHGGEIRVESKENNGTEFIIQLPTT
jgi:signal transduction histidine kinase